MEAPPSPLVRLAFLEFERRLRIPAEPARAIEAHFGAVKDCLERSLGLEYLAVSGSYGHGTDLFGASDIDLVAEFARSHISKDSRICLEDVAVAMHRQFPEANIRIDSPAVVMQFPDSPHVPLDIIPARKALQAERGMHYREIPNGRGGWRLTFTDDHKRYVTVADEVLGYDVKKLIRIIKAWNHLRGYEFSSLFLELFTTRYARIATRIIPGLERNPEPRLTVIITDKPGTSPELTSIDFASDIWAILGRLAERRLQGIRDPLEQIGNIAPFARRDIDRTKTLKKVREDCHIAESALRFENSGDTAMALSVWHVFFSGLFLDTSSEIVPQGPFDELSYGPEVAALAAELGEIWRSSGSYFDDAPAPESFSEAPAPKPKRRVLEIGKRLDSTGGRHLMYQVAQHILPQAGEDAISELSWAWDGIGSWLA